MEATPGGPPDRFRVLFVCTGNICRSPFAQFHTRFLLEARLGPHARRFAVASGGTSAVVGSGMHPLSRAQLASRADHPDVAAFRARQVPERDVAMADLVLTMSREHRGRVLQDVPQALGKAFTLLEFARLLEHAGPVPLPADPVERARGLVELALRTRGGPAPVPAEDDAVGDPIRGDEADHAAAAGTIDRAVRALVDPLRPPPPLPPPLPQSPPGRVAPLGGVPSPGPLPPAAWVPPPRPGDPRDDAGAARDAAAAVGRYTVPAGERSD